MSLNSLEDLYVEQLKDLYSAETQLVKALPKMAKAASTPELKTAFTQHLDQTEQHVQRLEQIFNKLGKGANGKKCKAMEGLIEEGKEVIDEKGQSDVVDAALIGAAQKVEHYEIAGYGTVRTFAQRLGYVDAVKLLQQTLDEEHAANTNLTKIAEPGVNEQAEKQQ
ncbi:MAG: ferritin-like domain-containing protein [Chloroflexota bacterium]